ncbi:MULTISPECIES: Ig-like domain-containing protein [unclassified Bradyrhizobium]|uniref:Ig-like domain-containing protein n=1 Tax=unclassified Bradyrhizobium TaxID=2631580 RepID=UPI0018CEB2AF|nr:MULTISPECIES: Ig-like domain-containing protein [unclassified Bradyrhizobium]
MENGIIATGSSLIQDNYIHDMNAPNVRLGTSLGGPHYDGIEIDGGVSDVVIRHNTVINENSWVSAVMINNDFGPVSNIQVDGNYLAGGGYTLYSDGSFSSTDKISGVQFTNNELGEGKWGYYYFKGNTPVLSNNDELGTGWQTSPTTPPSTPTIPATPTISSWSPDTGKTGDGITDASKVSLHGTAVAGSTIKVYDGSTQIGSTTATSSGSWDYITQVLSDAKHALTATATNSSGKTSVASAAVTVTVDTKAPAAPTIASDTVNTAHQVVMSGTAEANSAIKVFDGTTQVGTATTNSSGAWSVTTSALSSGSHALTAKATDVAGNVSAASTAIHPVIGSGTSGSTGSGTGTTAPAAPKIASFSTDSGVAGDHITSDKTLTLAGTAAANSTVKVFDGKTQLGVVTADASGAWHYATAALADGKHSFTATDTASGVTSKASTALDVTVDTAAPHAPVLLSDPTTHNRATVSGTAEAGSSIKLYEGTTLLGTATVASDGDWSVTTSNLKHGSHTFTATATDAAGNTSILSQPIDPPIGSHGANGTSTVEVTNVRQHWDHTATIKGTADPNSQIKLSDSTTSVGSVTTGADGKWSFQTSDLSGKSHAFAAEQVDTTGHVVGTSSGEAIIGTGRSNTLTSTSGNDVMVGKAGADTFVFASNFGQDVIKDFAARGPAHDTVQFSKGVFDTFASVLSHAAQSGGDVVIATGSDALTLKNTQLDKLNSHDFHFA